MKDKVLFQYRIDYNRLLVNRDKDFIEGALFEYPHPYRKQFRFYVSVIFSKVDGTVFSPLLAAHTPMAVTFQHECHREKVMASFIRLFGIAAERWERAARPDELVKSKSIEESTQFKGAEMFRNDEYDNLTLFTGEIDVHQK